MLQAVRHNQFKSNTLAIMLVPLPHLAVLDKVIAILTMNAKEICCVATEELKKLLQILLIMDRLTLVIFMD